MYINNIREHLMSNIFTVPYLVCSKIYNKLIIKIVKNIVFKLCYLYMLVEVYNILL